MTPAELQALIERYMEGSRGATFYAPEQWAAQGEEYGNRAALVVVYNGADAGQFFDYDWCNYKALEGLNEALRAVGYFHEDANGRYAGIYPIAKWASE
jgi:hypothetical protein